MNKIIHPARILFLSVATHIVGRLAYGRLAPYFLFFWPSSILWWIKKRQQIKPLIKQTLE
jgi:hypothetical protein